MPRQSKQLVTGNQRRGFRGRSGKRQDFDPTIDEKVTAVGQPTTLWQAIKENAPELVEAIHPKARTVVKLIDNHPGQRQWLIVEFALGNPDRVIKMRLDSVVDDQIATEDEVVWLPMSQQQISALRQSLEPLWRPVQTSLIGRIEDLGVLNKNARLLALLRMAERIEEDMYTDVDKQQRRYLLAEYRHVLRQIAEEKGELGEQTEHTDNKLAELVERMVRVVEVAAPVASPPGDAIDAIDGMVRELPAGD